MLAQQGAVRPEEERGAIERRAVPFDDPDHEVGLHARREAADPAALGAVDFDRRPPIAKIVLAAGRGPRTDPRPEVEPLWVAADIGFREDSEFDAFGFGRLAMGGHPVEGLGRVEQAGSGLDDGDVVLAHGETPGLRARLILDPFIEQTAFADGDYRYER
ncbi:hypothetical protein D3C85_813850 [compost metagenome]